VLAAVCIYLAAFALVVGCTRATGLLHAQLLQAVLRAPMAFFDTTPAGRIVNRFSKDTDTIDTLIPRNLEAWFKCTFHVIGTLLIICYSTPLFLVVAAPLGLFYYFVQVRILSSHSN
jgi:ATP-binding cassette subfamily C (CFTR/MRP) protein 1